WVRTIHDRAKMISVIDRDPAFAFSNLAYQTTITGLAFIYLLIYIYPALRTDPVAISIDGATLLLVLLAFYVPLQGMHRSLVEDKQRRLRAVRQQIEATFTKLHNQGAATDLSAIEHSMRVFPLLLQEEAYLTKLSTWPWASGTLSKLMTAAILPSVLLVADRLLGRLLS
ncbi:MAG: hypothetical protein KDE31_18105, partial [Caldilineaceae bacterium]|nr:hypothetical protein [Caldilineaceae bacterium]